MKTYCGTDIIEVERIKKAILSTPHFKEKLFTKNEIEYAESKSDITKYQHYAGRFAAKEAVFKSISALFPHVSLHEIEIINDADNLNRPIVIIHNDLFIQSKQNIQIDVSISHIKDVAISYAVTTIV